MPRFELRTAAGSEPPIELGQLDIGLDDGDTDPLQLVLTNREIFDLSEIQVTTQGPGSIAIELARDIEGVPGLWEREIIARQGVLPPNRACEFWVRAIPVLGLPLGDQEFDFVVRSVAIVVS